MATDVAAVMHRTARTSRDITMDCDCRLRFPSAPDRMSVDRYIYFGGMGKHHAYVNLFTHAIYVTSDIVNYIVLLITMFC